MLWSRYADDEFMAAAIGDVNQQVEKTRICQKSGTCHGHAL